MPRVFVVVPEAILGSHGDDHRSVRDHEHAVCGGGLIAALRNAGFLIVDPDVLGKLEISQIYRKGDVDNGMAKKIGSCWGRGRDLRPRCR